MNRDHLATELFEADRWSAPERLYRPTMSHADRAAWACFVAIALGLALAGILYKVMV